MRRHLLRFAVGLLTFIIGFASAVLFGAIRPWRRAMPPPARYEWHVPRAHTSPCGSPRFEGRIVIGPAHEWHEVRPGADFEPPPAPIRPRSR